MGLYDTTDLHELGLSSGEEGTKCLMSCDPRVERLVGIEVGVERMTMLELKE